MSHSGSQFKKDTATIRKEIYTYLESQGLNMKEDGTVHTTFRSLLKKYVDSVTGYMEQLSKRQNQVAIKHLFVCNKCRETTERIGHKGKRFKQNNREFIIKGDDIPVTQPDSEMPNLKKAPVDAFGRPIETF